MITKNFFVHPTGSQEAEPKAPKRSLVTTLEALRRADNGVEWDFNESTGELRILTTSSDAGFVNRRFNGDARAHARMAINKADIKRAFNFGAVQLVDGEVAEFDWGYRVEFRQVHSVRGRVSAIPVRNGYVHVAMDKSGKVFQIESTLRFGDKPQTIGRVLSRAEAIRRAKEKLVEILAQAKAAEDIARATSKLGDQLGGIELAKLVQGIIEKGIDTEVMDTARGFYRPSVDGAEAECLLVFSLHDDEMNPVYEIRISMGEPRQYWQFLVMAKSGDVVHQYNLLHYMSTPTTKAAEATATGTKVRTVLRIPSPKVDISEQVKDAVLEKALPDPTVLENDDFVVYVGSGKKKVKALPDGTFHYGVKTPEFGAVVTFVWLTIFHNLLIELGMKKAGKKFEVYVGDPNVRDNAYFDPEKDDSHIGKGSGLKRGGLREDISHDPGVAGHEYGHRVVYIQTPGKDLPGRQGAGMHESTGDALGTLWLNYVMQILFEALLGRKLTLKDIKEDRRVIGEYVLPPDGIRIQRNDKKTPGDETGEPHDDGLISGGAHADLLEAYASRGGDAELMENLKAFARLYLMALSLVPAHKVTFRDMLRCMITADQNLAKGENRKLIEEAHKAHGITGTSAVNVPVVIVTAGRRRRK